MLNILVTGTGGGGVGEQLIKALRLSSLSFVLHGTDTSPISKGLKDADVFHTLCSASDKRYVDELLLLCRQARIQVLFPGSEPELKVISSNRRVFEEAGVFVPINPDHVISICLDKSRTSAFLEGHGFHSPKSVTISGENDLGGIDFFPLVLKPSIGGGGSANIMVAQNRDELLLFGKYLLGIYDQFIIQQYVGNADSEYTVGVLLDMKGRLINSIAIRRIIHSGLGHKLRVRNKTGDASLGDFLTISSGISQGEVVPRFELNKVCEDIAVRLGATSSINIQCRYTAGKTYVFEINPRYSGTTPLRALVGYNEPEVLINQQFHGVEPQKYFEYKKGYVLRGLKDEYLEPGD